MQFVVLRKKSKKKLFYSQWNVAAGHLRGSNLIWWIDDFHDDLCLSFENATIWMEIA